MDDPNDFWAGDGYIELMLWRNRKRFDDLRDTSGAYFRGVACFKGEKEKKKEYVKTTPYFVLDFCSDSG
jgi:hypothetical protein